MGIVTRFTNSYGYFVKAKTKRKCLLIEIFAKKKKKTTKKKKTNGIR